MKTYAAYYNNKVRMDSSSGGVFTLIASRFEVVYGVALTEDCFGAEFIRVENDIAPLRGSKYFQAKIKDTFKQVKKDLIDGKKVLFSGTGCQINGIKLFLQKEYDNLFCVDVICHGTPSPKLWREYLHYQEQKLGKITKVNFRSKDEGWINFGIKQNDTFISIHTDSFMQMFLRNYCLRPSCYECHAKKMKLSDITIADFWGIQYVAPDMHDDKGTSLVIARTDNGQLLFDEIKENLVYKEVSYEDGVRFNPSEYRSVDRPEQRENFFKDLSSLPFEEMEKKYASPIIVPLWRKVAGKAKRAVKKLLCK